MSSPGRPELHKIVAFCLVSSMCLTRGIYLVYLARVGLSFTEVAVYQATFSASTAILEVSTGLAGDWLGKRRALCLGSLLLASHALMMLAVPVVPYVAAAVVEATAYAFISGSDRALLYEAMQGSGSEGRYLQVSSRLMAAESLVSGASIAAGSLLTEISWSLPFVLSAAACVAQLVIAASIQQHDPLALERVGGGEGWTLASRLRGALAPIASSAGFVIVMFGLLDGVYGGFYSLNQLLFDGLGIATPPSAGSSRRHTSSTPCHTSLRSGSRRRSGGVASSGSSLPLSSPCSPWPCVCTTTRCPSSPQPSWRAPCRR